MTVIRRNSEALRREIDAGLDEIIRTLRLAGLSSDIIKKELHAAVDRVLREENSPC